VTIGYTGISQFIVTALSNNVRSVWLFRQTGVTWVGVSHSVSFSHWPIRCPSSAL